MPIDQIDYALKTNTGPVFTLRHGSNRRIGAAGKKDGVVVNIKRQQDGDAGTVGPTLRLQTSASSDSICDRFDLIRA